MPALLRDAANEKGVAVDFTEITYYVSRFTFLATDAGKMGRISESLFAFMARNAVTATSYFGLPAEHVVELGMQVDL